MKHVGALGVLPIAGCLHSEETAGDRGDADETRDPADDERETEDDSPEGTQESGETDGVAWNLEIAGVREGDDLDETEVDVTGSAEVEFEDDGVSVVVEGVIYGRDCDTATLDSLEVMDDVGDEDIQVLSIEVVTEDHEAEQPPCSMDPREIQYRVEFDMGDRPRDHVSVNHDGRGVVDVQRDG